MVENTSHVATCEISAVSKDQLILFHRGSDLLQGSHALPAALAELGALSCERGARAEQTSEEWPLS